MGARITRGCLGVVGLCLLVATGCSDEPKRFADAGADVGGTDSGVGPPDDGPEPTPDTGPIEPDRGPPPDAAPDAAPTCDGCADGEACVEGRCLPCERWHRDVCCDYADPGVCPPIGEPSSCMACHNGDRGGETYAGPGIQNPHPFPGASHIPCVTCHGGDPRGAGKSGSHVGAPPAIGDRLFQQNDERAFFLRRTLVGIERLIPETYTDRNSGEWSTLDYLQFVNPGDLRVVAAERGCGAIGCHADEHAQWVPRSIIATSTGLFSSTRFSVGVDNRIPDHRGLDEDTLADSAPKPVTDPGYNPDNRRTGQIGRLVEQPEHAQFGGRLVDNGSYVAATLAEHVVDADIDPRRPNRVSPGSPLEVLIDEQVNITCGNCHLYSAGDNNRYGDFRSSGCSACHMAYAPSGRHIGLDPNIPRDEPQNPDAIAPGERAHIADHIIRNVYRELPGDRIGLGIGDHACAGCHQGSNRTVMQFWGIRLDQNRDLTDGFQYPAAPDAFTDTADDPRLFDRDPNIANATFNGRTADQYIAFEDYDADGRDDTPPDIHHERGLGCIDCHGSRDLHGGTAGDVGSGEIVSRQDQATAIQCESCHGSPRAYAATAPCTTYDGDAAECLTDAAGNPLRHVTRNAAGETWLRSRLDGRRHYVMQTRDVTRPTGAVHPITRQAIYDAEASYAMGIADGDPSTGTGPVQADLNNRGFDHTAELACATCHAAWTNNCIGCHLATRYEGDPAQYLFSNLTGERILLAEQAADFVYQSPVMSTLGIDGRGRIARLSPAEKVFWHYVDQNGDTSDIFAFGDRRGEGNNPARGGRNDFPALSANPMMPHSIRGRVDANNEGPLYCVGCHITDAMLADADTLAQYDAFVAAYEAADFAAIDFDVLATHIGQNPGNQLGSPFYVRMMAGLGTGLFLFDADGCPINPLDARADRAGCAEAPADVFADRVDAVAFDLDRVVQPFGAVDSSGAHPVDPNLPGGSGRAPARPVAGPLDVGRLELLVGADDIRQALVLDGWLDADGQAAGSAIDLTQ